jgi:hypothetical protein
VDSIQQKQPAETDCPAKSNNPALYNNGGITSPDDIIPLNKRTVSTSLSITGFIIGVHWHPWKHPSRSTKLLD